MTQAQLDAINFSLQSNDFLSVQCEFQRRRIICSLDTDTFLVIKRMRKDAYIFLKKGKTMLYIFLKKGKTMLKLKPEIYELVCDAKVSVSFLRSY